MFRLFAGAFVNIILLGLFTTDAQAEFYRSNVVVTAPVATQVVTAPVMNRSVVAVQQPVDVYQFRTSHSQYVVLNNTAYQRVEPLTQVTQAYVAVPQTTVVAAAPAPVAYTYSQPTVQPRVNTGPYYSYDMLNTVANK